MLFEALLVLFFVLYNLLILLIRPFKGLLNTGHLQSAPSKAS